jgi:dienelactone hydrolase
MMKTAKETAIAAPIGAVPAFFNKLRLTRFLCPSNDRKQVMMNTRLRQPVKHARLARRKECTTWARSGAQIERLPIGAAIAIHALPGVYHFVVKSLPRRAIFLLALLLAAGSYARAQQYVERQVRIPWVLAGLSGLDALLVYVDLPGKHPLVVLTHGTSRKPEERVQVNSWQLLPQAIWFARRGYVALVVVRRGYGTSGGDPDTNHGGHCPMTDYEQAASYSAEDLRIAIDYARKLPQVDDTHVLAAGVSTGGLATVALTANAPAGLVAAINFAGGRGSKSDHDVCNSGDLVHAYRSFGKHSRIPMLWIYAQNDKYFWPELAQQFDAAFRSQGGQDQFVLAPAIGEDGHTLFHHIPAWTATVDEFLKAQNLMPLAELLPDVKAPDLPPPAGLSETGQRAFHAYLLAGPHKAFATSEHGFGMAVASLSPDIAKEKALDNCKHTSQNHETCAIVYIDEKQVSP